MRISSARSTKPIAALALFVALTFCPLIHAQNQAQTPPCTNTTASSGTTQNSSSSSISQGAQNVENAAKNLGSIFKKKKTTANSAATTPCTSPSLTPATPNTNAPNTAGAPAQPAPDATPASPAASSTPGDAAAPSQGGSAPWQPPSGSPSSAAPAGLLDPAKLPDVLGIHLGAPREGVSGLLLKLYPGNSIRPEGPDTVAGLSMINIDLPGKSGSDNVHVEYTLTPGKQRVYYIERGVFYKQHMSRDNVVAALRQKYGQEIYVHPNGGETYWLFDEQGHPIPPDKKANGSPYGCDADDASGKMLFHSQINAYLHGALPPATFCDSVIVLRVTLPQDQYIDRIFTVLEDRALLRREVTAAGEAQKAQNQKQQQQDLKNAQQAKPVL
ncbi:MAG TPA: hypothetical protein VEO19_17650 [Terriglobia bacterium]|nr:hypothetical protein [Terriglobia bacterium]